MAAAGSGTVSITKKTPEHVHVEDMVHTRVLRSPIYALLLADVRIIAASKGLVTARLLLTESHMNSSQSLHGSVSATIVDWMGGMAIATHDLRTKTGVSVDIHVSYLSGAKVGEELEIEGVADKVGGSLAFTKVTLFKVEDGKRGRIVVTGLHTKYVKGSESQKTVP